VHQLVFAAVAAATVHAFALGSDLADGWPRYWWLALLCGYGATFVWVKLVKPLRLKRRPFTVAAVTPINYNTTGVELEVPAGVRFRYVPGQFAFLELYREGLPVEEHPFTLSSTPSRAGRISFSIKSSGDYTATISRTKVGDTARIDGPYGQFCHLIRGGQELVMIAGGVGITPILSMLRYMADAAERRRVTLVWGNRAERDMLFREELTALQAKLPQLAVHHVLSEQADWAGEKGFVDEARLRRLLASCDRKATVFLCGPPPMMKLVSAALRRIGFSRWRIHTERFSL
jgi:predicted ferric reductase